MTSGTALTCSPLVAGGAAGPVLRQPSLPAAARATHPGPGCLRGSVLRRLVVGRPHDGVAVVADDLAHVEGDLVPDHLLLHPPPDRADARDLAAVVVHVASSAKVATIASVSKALTVLMCSAMTPVSSVAMCLRSFLSAGPRGRWFQRSPVRPGESQQHAGGLTHAAPLSPDWPPGARRCGSADRLPPLCDGSDPGRPGDPPLPPRHAAGRDPGRAGRAGPADAQRPDRRAPQPSGRRPRPDAERRCLPA